MNNEIYAKNSCHLSDGFYYHFYYPRNLTKKQAEHIRTCMNMHMDIMDEVAQDNDNLELKNKNPLCKSCGNEFDESIEELYPVPFPKNYTFICEKCRNKDLEMIKKDE